LQEKLIEQAKEYTRVAHMVRDHAEEASHDTELKDYIDGALTRLYYAETLRDKLAATQSELDESMDKATYDVMHAAADAVDEAANLAFDMIEAHSDRERKFRKKVEKTSVNTESEDLGDLLRQLYKCIGILRMAYRAARRVPIYAMAQRSFERLDGMEREVPSTPEDVIMKETGIDVYELKDIRKKLLAAIEPGLKGMDP